MPIRIFIIYSKHDRSFLDELLKHFYSYIQNKTIEVFHDGVIEEGNEWDETIKENLHRSDIILLLVSVDFMVADYFYDEEMAAVIALHKQGKAQVIPIMARPFDFEDGPLNKLDFLPEEAKSISGYTDHREAYTHIVEKLEERNYPIALQRRRQNA